MANPIRRPLVIDANKAMRDKILREQLALRDNTKVYNPAMISAPQQMPGTEQQPIDNWRQSLVDRGLMEGWDSNGNYIIKNKKIKEREKQLQGPDPELGYDPSAGSPYSYANGGPIETFRKMFKSYKK